MEFMPHSRTKPVPRERVYLWYGNYRIRDFRRNGAGYSSRIRTAGRPRDVRDVRSVRTAVRQRSTFHHYVAGQRHLCKKPNEGMTNDTITLIANLALAL